MAVLLLSSPSKWPQLPLAVPVTVTATAASAGPGTAVPLRVISVGAQSATG